ncbi:multicopper oxidase family protein [Natrinema salsiterrestre]|uniref:Multicopper oxidase CueO n=1 Tax=Natrinema salsiterrestre TaxID=2950540 RepID=A0A9Q4KXL1_9EURY|nr:multicopper oxidase [Natrinema salsiterrestre]MDF9745285.1 multicopper oxidase [Natrinema salsiterrestre]
MRDLSRRLLLRASATLGVAGSVPSGVLAAEDEHDGDHSDGDGDGGHSSDAGVSPHLEKYKRELPIPEERPPDGTRNGADYHEIEVKETTHSFHPDLEDTTIWGFGGQFPGPLLAGDRNEELAIEFDNSQLPDEHLFEIDDRIEGTTSENYVDYDGPVPDVRTVTHFHGLNTATESDGQADMWTSPDGVTGPRFQRDVQEMPNRQSRMSTVYHDHARGISRLNNYAGLVGPYIIRSQREEQLDLPEDEYDIPLVLADRSFEDDGSLHYPEKFVANFAGDTATVNGKAWPYLEVEPRKYRFRIANVSNGRTYDLSLENEDEDHDAVPTMFQIAPDHGFLEEVVSIGHGGDMESLIVAPFERAEIVVDFSDHAGETFTVTNDAEFPYEGGMDHGDGGMDHGDGMDGMDMGGDGGMGHGDMEHPEIDEVMQIRVTEETTEPDTSTHPSDLRLPNRNGPNPAAAKTTREMTMGMGTDEHGLMIHKLNGRTWGDEIQHKPQLGTTEIWELVNDDMHTHPIHLHLVEFEVLERERHNTDHGPQPPLPNERGGKDVVRVNPGETVRIAAKFGDFAGKYPFHCHILEHEEHAMMRMFEVVEGNSNDAPGRDAGGNSGREGGPDRGR